MRPAWKALAMLALAVGLAGCFSSSGPVDPGLLARLTGSWQEEHGPGRVRFYSDETVKLTLPDFDPPLKILSQLERVKDDRIGFSIGDRWSGPVYVELDAESGRLTLRMEGKKSHWERHFVRSRGR